GSLRIDNAISMSFIKQTIKWFFKNLSLIIFSALALVLLASGVGVAIFLRRLDLDYGAIIVPAIIVEVICAAILYNFSRNFFPKDERPDLEVEKR
ncbi:MAG: hypothetical protein ACFFCS_14745, partial [Candidatus Hodarchaeota archaeon]